MAPWMRHIGVFHISYLPARRLRTAARANSFPGGHSGREPPDPIPNSEVKTLCADGSVAVGHVRVGHCQDPIKGPRRKRRGLFFFSAHQKLLAASTAKKL